MLTTQEAAFLTGEGLTRGSEAPPRVCSRFLQAKYLINDSQQTHMKDHTHMHAWQPFSSGPQWNWIKPGPSAIRAAGLSGSPGYIIEDTRPLRHTYIHTHTHTRTDLQLQKHRQDTAHTHAVHSLPCHAFLQTSESPLPEVKLASTAKSPTYASNS